MRRFLSIRYLLLTANTFVLLLALFAAVFLRLWDSHLVRVAEERLMGESVLIGEAWRDALARSSGAVAGGLPEHLEPGDVPSLPDAPTLDLGGGPAAPAPPPSRREAAADTPEWRAGAALQALLARAARLSHTTVEVLNRSGCAVATSTGLTGECYDHLPEVQGALAGRYGAVAREIAPRRLPAPLNRLERTSGVRVSIATPVLADGGVIGVVRMAETTDSPLMAVWKYRRTVAVGMLGCLLLMASVSLFLSRTISRPVRAITAAADAVARGKPPAPFAPSGLVPREVAVLSAALDRMTAQLTDRANYIAAFAANVSHELKTPITAIRGAVELLRDEWDAMSEVQRQRFLENIDADASRMQRLVSRLLELARIQSSPEGAETVQVEPFFARLADRYGAQVEIDTASAPETVLINPDYLATAVQNLVDNAIRHGAGKPVEVIVRGANGKLAISVHDRGPGISPGNRGRIFERFFTTERDRGGTGLGLAIVRAVAETRGGRVTFDTGEAGTTFTLVV